MKTLVRRYEIKAPVDDVFEALTKTEHIENWTDDIADFNTVPNGKFSYWDGSIIGRNIEISKYKIVQDWKEETWDAYTRVTIKLSKNGDSTNIELIHKDIPNEAFSNISEGWDTYYFGALKEYLVEEDE